MIDQFSGIVALFAFFVVTVIGLLHGEAAGAVLEKALIGMVVFLVVGKVLGYIGKRLISEQVEEGESEELGVRSEELGVKSVSSQAPPPSAEKVEQ
jgi:hypothetical protein